VDTWDFAQNANFSWDVDAVFRLRIEVEEQNGKNQLVLGTLEYSYNGGAFTPVSITSAVVKAVASGQFTNGDATSDLLTASAKTFTPGEGSEDATPTNVSLNNTHTEWEYALQIVGADVANDDTIAFQVVGLDGYTVTPTVTAVKSGTTVEETASANRVMATGAADQLSAENAVTANEVDQIAVAEQLDAQDVDSEGRVDAIAAASQLDGQNGLSAGRSLGSAVESRLVVEETLYDAA
jgi:hypothetical protein